MALESLAAASVENSLYYHSAKGVFAPVALGGGLIFDVGTLSAPGGGATEYGFESLTTAPPNPRRIRFNNASAASAKAMSVPIGMPIPACVAVPELKEK